MDSKPLDLDARQTHELFCTFGHSLGLLRRQFRHKTLAELAHEAAEHVAVEMVEDPQEKSAVPPAVPPPLPPAPPVPGPPPVPTVREAMTLVMREESVTQGCIVKRLSHYPWFKDTPLPTLHKLVEKELCAGDAYFLMASDTRFKVGRPAKYKHLFGKFIGSV